MRQRPYVLWYSFLVIIPFSNCRYSGITGEILFDYYTFHYDIMISAVVNEYLAIYYFKQIRFGQIVFDIKHQRALMLFTSI